MSFPIDRVPYVSFDTFVAQLCQQLTVEESLNHLRQKYAILNPNLILYALWHAQLQQGRLQKQSFKTLQTAIYLWDDRLVSALRRLLRAVDYSRHSKAKQMASLVCAEILYANAIEQQLLEQALAKKKLTTRPALQQLLDACYNLISYFKYMQTRLDESDQQASIVILQAAFPDLSTIEVIESFKRAMDAVKADEHPYLQLTLENL